MEKAATQKENDVLMVIRAFTSTERRSHLRDDGARLHAEAHKQGPTRSANTHTRKDLFCTCTRAVLVMVLVTNVQ